MADTIKSSSELKMVFGFDDNDDRTATLQNPRNDLTASDIKVVSAFIKTNNLLIGDKAGAACVGIKTAKSLQKTVTQLDLSNI